MTTDDHPTLSDLPMGGCSTNAAHFAHLDRGEPRCENVLLTEDAEPWPHSTAEVRMLGRKRSLIASADYAYMILLDDGGGFDPTREDLFRIIAELADRLDRIERIVG